MVLHTNWGFSSLTEFTVSFTFNHKQISDWIFFFPFCFSFFGQPQQFWYHGSVVVTRGRWEGWHLQLMVLKMMKSRVALKEAETISIIIIIIIIIILVCNSSNIQAVTRTSETTPVQNENRATTRLEPAIVSRHQQLLGGGGDYSQT